MDAETGLDQQALRAQLAEAQERLDALVRDLREIDGELDALSTERRQHQLLGEACGALEQLAELGGAALFWGESPAAGSGHQLLRARSLADGFAKRIDEIEERRHEVLEQVLLQQGEQQRAGQRQGRLPPHAGTSPWPARPHRGVIDRTVCSSTLRACSAPAPVRR